MSYWNPYTYYGVLNLKYNSKIFLQLKKKLNLTVFVYDMNAVEVRQNPHLKFIGSLVTRCFSGMWLSNTVFSTQGFADGKGVWMNEMGTT